MCGEYHHFEEMDEYNGEIMCVECVESERLNDAEKALTPDFSEIFKTA